MTSLDVPALPGLLSASEVQATVTAIARTQEPSGALPWFRGGPVDPWDHVECTMALLVGGQVEAAERGYDWLFGSQRRDGSWPTRFGRRATGAADAAVDTNLTAYVAVGVWHHWLVRRDAGFLARAWPVVRRALDLVAGLQLPFGGIAWARDARGRVADSALVAGSSSISHALGCGLALADLLVEPQPEWELAAGRLSHALREHEELFAPKARYAMDWYYPVLGGALRGRPAGDRIDARWHDFVVPDVGVRCVDDHPWVTGAETCELVLALDALGRREQALRLLADMQHLRDPDGSYWTGYVFADDARWPVERSTWTSAAVVLAVDAVSRTTAGADIFRGSTYARNLPAAGLACQCARARSADVVAGVSAHAG
jgi:hypothetical protein